MKEEEGVDGDNHDQTNLSAQEMSKLVSCLEFKIKIIYYVTAYIFYGCLVILNIIKLSRELWTSRKFSFPKIRQLYFRETFKLLICFIASFAIFLMTFYFYIINRAQCPLTFPKYQFRFCECDLLERDFHKFFYIPEYELNRLCVSRYNNTDMQHYDYLYVDSEILFSDYMQTKNNDKGTGMGHKCDQRFHKIIFRSPSDDNNWGYWRKSRR